MTCVLRVRYQMLWKVRHTEMTRIQFGGMKLSPPVYHTLLKVENNGLKMDKFVPFRA